MNEPMDDLAKRLSTYFDRPVLDRTGITGSFDFRCEYHADGQLPDRVGAIQWCLRDIGLRLESAKAPIEKIVIEHAEKPTPN
jgi:uncharacterized protein (TIGR03435 family)